MTLLDILLLTDPLYRRLYLQLDERLNTIDDAIVESLNTIDQRLSLLHNQKLALQHNAYIDEDGKRLYRGEHNAAFYEDGTMVDPRKAASIEWQPHHSHWKDHQHINDQISTYETHKRDIIDYRDGIVQSTRERMQDHQNPMDHDELKASLTALDHHMPDFLKQATSHTVTQDISLSPMASAFRENASVVGNTVVEQPVIDIPDEFTFAQPVVAPALALPAFK